MAFAFVRRTARGTSFHTPDKQHIHHRLLRLGHGPRRSVLILWAWTAVLSAFLLVPLFVHRANAFIPLGAAALGVGLYTLFHPGLRKGNGDVGDAEDENRLDPGVPAEVPAPVPAPAPAPAHSAQVVRLP
jgi:UDP-GlcNAc:undecaprenyl-phosphate GlcNAc-1-phosphate transferase